MFYPEADLQRLDVQVRFGQQLLKPAVLGFQRLQALRVGGLHAAVLRPPLVEGRVAEAVLAAQLGDHHPRFGLLEKPDDLLGGESALAHVRPLWVNGLYLLSVGTAGGEQVNATRQNHSSEKITNEWH